VGNFLKIMILKYNQLNNNSKAEKLDFNRTIVIKNISDIRWQ